MMPLQKQLDAIISQLVKAGDLNGQELRYRLIHVAADLILLMADLSSQNESQDVNAIS